MITQIIEVSNGFNFGKFMIGRFDDPEWSRQSEIDKGRPLLHSIGHGRDALMVFDLQTCEGAVFTPGGLASADLNKHRIWVCPLYEPFLEWLYKQDTSDLAKLPDMVELPDAPGELSGYRRPGPNGD